MMKINSSWKKALLPEFEKPYMQGLRDFLQQEISAKKIIYPKTREYFAAFDFTAIDRVKVVILGQDPYHGPGQAHGFCFSVRPGVNLPPSLVNIFKELKTDLEVPRPDHGCLISWAIQGVLLLNATLSVQASMAGSHQNKGWENFTDAVIDYLNREKEGIVFLLWGSFAQKKGAFIDKKKHLVLTAPHPSPLSAHRGFLGCKHFSQTNNYLKKRGVTPIDWALPPKEKISELQ
ncbi:MAG: uracil-DNA glycosylase [Bdellovibrionales bacterium RBG_16_40_8]|nr:MAG: uracil-DNA glycosylase [Bdellovibrionales bacterium RBG_16_40_8]